VSFNVLKTAGRSGWARETEGKLWASTLADHRAIFAVTEAIVRQLRAEVRPGDFGTPVQFAIYGSRDFSETLISNGASLFLYRILPNGVRRAPPGGIGSDGRRRPTIRGKHNYD
jgi:hypothetical protein